MKTQLNNFSRGLGAPSHKEGGLVAPKRSEGGMATLIFIILLSIMLILVMVEVHSLARLHTEVKLLEQQQIKRLNAPQTNTVSTVTHP